jgi:uncharacterized protein (DUF488 family)
MPHLLDQAADLIEEHAKTLNRKHQPCPHCHREFYENWADQQEGRELDVFVRRLRQLAAKEKGNEHHEAI